MIFVTGASGNVGQAVVRLLRERGAPFRIGVRKPASFAAQPGEEVVPFDFLDQATYLPAVHGCDALFLLRPPAVADTGKTLNPLIDVARAQGVRQIVFISVAGAADNRIVPHHAVEQHLRHGAGGWTILRPGFFAQNLGDAYQRDICEQDRLYVPAGMGRAAFIDVRDVAEVAILALIEPEPHHRQCYTLTGPEAIGFTAAAEILSLALGRTIHYQPASIPGYMLHLKRRQQPFAQIVVQTVLHVGLRFGQAEAVDPALARLLGRPSRTLKDYVSDHRMLWLPNRAGNAHTAPG